MEYFQDRTLLSMGNDRVVKRKHILSTTADFLYRGLRLLELPCTVQNRAVVLKLVQTSVCVNAVPSITRLNEKQGEGDSHLSTSWSRQAFLHCCSLQFAFIIRSQYICSETGHNFPKTRAARPWIYHSALGAEIVMLSFNLMIIWLKHVIWELDYIASPV